MLHQSVQKELPTQHAEHQLVSERAVFGAHLVLVGGQKDGRKSAFFFDAAQDVEGRAARGRDDARGLSAFRLPPVACRFPLLHPNSSPASTRAPFRKSRTLIR